MRTPRGFEGPRLPGLVVYDTLAIWATALKMCGFPVFLCIAAADPAADPGTVFSPAPPPMTLTLDDVRRIAHLARIEIDAREAGEVHAKLEAIFAMIDQLQAVDTTGVEPMSHAQDVVLALREDRVTETDHRAEYQRIAPAVEDGLYLVPRVVE